MILRILVIQGYSLTAFGGQFAFRAHEVPVNWLYWVVTAIVTKKFWRPLFGKRFV